MKDGFIRVCASTPDIKVADCECNTNHIIENINYAYQNGAKLVVFPELCITGYTCGDLFLQKTLIDSALCQLIRIKEETASLDILSVVGVPMEINQKLYNCGVVMYKGQIKGIVPKCNIPNYSEFYEARHFNAGRRKPILVNIAGAAVPFGTDILFQADTMPDFVLGVEICEDLWVPNPPSTCHALAGATVIVNLSASDETIGKADYRRNIVSTQSAKLYCAYLYADAGAGESTTDLVFAGADMIAENGAILTESKHFVNESVFAEIDVQKLVSERKRTTTFQARTNENYEIVNISFDTVDTVLTRYISQTPFVPLNDAQRAERCEEILSIQSQGLKKRLQHAYAKTAVIGVSGGLDSTLALLVTARAFDAIGADREGIIAVTMPCFGTTDRTYKNAVEFAKSLGVTFREIRIEQSVLQHFADIGHDPDVYDVTYENTQARERTQILMDIANQTNGMVVGTGDLSELALGWATYNGDHMSMYAVNASVPKTLIRYLVGYEADRTNNEKLKITLNDILNTPVSPELLPPKDGEISQKTEHIVGPYELHDFFLYYIMRFGFTPKKVLRLAVYAFSDKYEKEFILSWLKIFYKRFFTQQFKRSCIPDGPKVGSVALSPRGDWRMPSDASYHIWMEELENIEI